MSGRADNLRERFRVPVMVVFLIASCGGVSHFHGSDFFLRYLLYSLIGNAATAALLWIEWTAPRGAQNNWISLYLFLLTPGRFDWRWDTRSGIIGSVVFAAFVLLMMFVVSSASMSKAKTNVRIDSADDAEGRLRSENPVFDLIISAIVLDNAIEFVTNRGHSFLWAFPFIPQMLLFVWAAIVYRIAEKKINPTNNLSIVNRTTNS
jgi:hypothetical protein